MQLFRGDVILNEVNDPRRVRGTVAAERSSPGEAHL